MIKQQQRCSGCKNWSSIMDSVCSCFHVPGVEENVESNSSDHSGGARIKTLEGPRYNLKTKYGRLPNNQNITPKISRGMIMQLGSNSGATSKACYLESVYEIAGTLVVYLVCSILTRYILNTILTEFAPIDPEITAQCGHMYHLKCMYEWLERSGKCPVCAKGELSIQGNASYGYLQRHWILVDKCSCQTSE
ncbi:hypothetical protein RHMOL_Rhmol09G0178700 [Rhododendron molle]|uniref:Uncharacterized protein n=1 Tax=Rhododendron molle TaxID=49168 RepID=A0ACC0MGE2_RHOML|nr:hypothetical protein RHMOL_Rhmol09G0178700 [Rhododendron molle]